MHWPSLSIIIPSFNQGKYLERTLLSILKQDYAGDVEVIVADGGSNDQTVDVLKKYPQIRWWSKPDKGFVDAVTQGIAVSQGEILAIQCSDDFYLPGAFQRAIKALVAEPTLGLVAGCDIHLQADMQSYFLSNLDSYYITPRSLLMQRIIPQHCAFFRRHILEKIGGLRAEVDTCADLDLWYRALHFFQGKFIPYHTAVYQRHADQRTKVLNTWYDSLVLMVESCETTPLYRDKFILSREEKQNLYKRWEIQWSILPSLNHDNKEQIEQIVLSVLNTSTYTQETKDAIRQFAVNHGLFRAPKYKRYVSLGVNAIRDGTFVEKLKRKLSKAFATQSSQLANDNIDMHWWKH